MPERVKTINYNLIMAMTREEINAELVKNGDWSIDYFVPGRIFYPYYIIVNRHKYRFDKL